MEPLFLRMARHPPSFLIIPKHSLSELVVYFDKPAQEGSVDQGLFRSPAEGVGMTNSAMIKKFPLFFQISDDNLIGILEIEIFEMAVFGVKAAIIV